MGHAKAAGAGGTIGSVGILSACMLVCAPAHLALAHGTERSSPYRMELAWDATITVGLGLTAGATALYRNEEPYTNACGQAPAGSCRLGDLVGLDRYAVGRQSHTWRWVSDISQAGGMILPFAWDAADVFLSEGNAPLRGWATDAGVMLQAQLLAGVFNNVLKVSIHRPRPRQYRAKTYTAVAESDQAFPCGHCIATTTGAAALAVTYWLRHPDAPSRFVVTAAAAAYSAVGSWARVEAGAHFPSDVIAGIAIGAMCGILVPLAHVDKTASRLRDDGRPDDDAAKSEAWRVQLIPNVGPDGRAGATLSWSF